MKSRFLIALAAAFVLVFLVVILQFRLGNLSEDLAEKTDRVCACLSRDGGEEEGMELLEELISDFDRNRPFFAVVVSDSKIHEIDRSLNRARQLGAEGEISPALEALSDLSGTLRELAETHRPAWENIL